jgi:hypothetical protein
MKNLKKTTKENEMVSLNDNLYDSFFIQELESRLETDPLAVGGIVDFFNDASNYSPSECWCILGSCGEYS